MTTSPSDPGGKTGARGWFVMALIVAVGLVALVVSGAVGVDRPFGRKAAHTIQAFGITWEPREVVWREAEGMYAVSAELYPVGGSGRVPSGGEAFLNTFCGAFLAMLPPDAPVAHRREVFRTDLLLRDGDGSDLGGLFTVAVTDGACTPMVDGDVTLFAYPGLVPDWVFRRWKAENPQLDDFRVVFERQGDQPLSSIDPVLACRAALFDLPDMLGEHAPAFAAVTSLTVVAEARIGFGELLSAARSITWEVPLGPGGCGSEAREIET